MTNAEIVAVLEQTARLLELHGENDFKVRSFQNAAFQLDKTPAELATLSVAELSLLPGVGRALAANIDEIRRTGTLHELQELLAKTPDGLLDFFSVKGIGPKKIRQIWQELGISDLPALTAAAESGELAKLKGFGPKVVETIRESLHFRQQHSGQVRMDVARSLADALLDVLETAFDRVAITGAVRQQHETVSTVQLVVGTHDPTALLAFLAQQQLLATDAPACTPFTWRGFFRQGGVAAEVISVPPESFVGEVFVRSAAAAHLSHQHQGTTLLQVARQRSFASEEDLYRQAGLPFHAPELREALPTANARFDDLITFEALRGTLHNHSTWSDGQHSLADMAAAAAELGLQYLGMADHSRTAAYANGLSIDRVLEQHAEIDRLNEDFSGKNFKIYKGIESDILGDGSLDYPEEILKTFDFVVASVHQNLSMTEEKAMQRLLRAIENPYTTILGHPTGRLLLIRPGYPVNHRKIIDACAANGVVMELNADPHRLDLDWRHIGYALERGVRVSINPDAHHREAYLNMHYGVAVARKGGLTRQMTFNALSRAEMDVYLQQRKS